METKLLIVGVVLIVAGLIRHFIPRAMIPRLGFNIVLPGWMIAGLGVILVIAGLILG